MRQRVTIGLATVCEPEFVIADEPTTALDVVVQKDVLGLIKDLQRDMGSSIVFVTHDMAVHANIADRVGIIYAGRLVEEAPTRTLFAAPRHPYTAHLSPACRASATRTQRPALEGRPPNLANPPAGCRFHPRCPLVIEKCTTEVPPLELVAPGQRSACWRWRDVEPIDRVPARIAERYRDRAARGPRCRKRFPIGGVLSGREVRAVDDASFSVGDDGPEIFTIIGESGSGKTTLARMILGLERPSSGEIMLRGPTGHACQPARAAGVHGQGAAGVPEPVRGVQSAEARRPLSGVDGAAFPAAARPAGIDAAMDGALQKVGLSLAEVRGRFPHELSGGQLQRVAIARALIPNPPLLIADEPVSMVDASLRMAIVNLLRHLRDEMGVSVIYITHDLATAYYISDRLMIMQRGLIVEMGPARTVLDDAASIPIRDCSRPRCCPTRTPARGDCSRPPT